MRKNLYFTISLDRVTVFSVVFLTLFISALTAGIFVSSRESLAVTSDVYPVIIIDPGHGGEDGGTQSYDGTLEKDINLAISLKLNELLRSKGFSTVLTRDGDYMIYDESASTQREKKVSDIKNRLKIIEENNNCILLSVHQNYFKESKYHGLQVFYSKNHPSSKFLADEIQKSVSLQLQPDNTRQIKESGTDIYLLYHSPVPSVMVECGFMSNEAEADKLKNEDYQKLISEYITEGLIKFIEGNSEGEKINGDENKKYFRVQ